MKKVLSNNITSTAKQPFIKQTFQHYEDITTDLTQALCLAIGNETTSSFILYGCEISLVGSDVYVAEGAIYSSGEIFLVDAKVFVGLGSINSALYANLVTTYNAIDPILFSDGNTYNVHQNRKITFYALATGNDLFNLQTIKYYRVNNKFEAYQLGSGKFTANTGGVTYTTGKRWIRWKYEMKSNTITVNFEFEQVDFAANNISYFDIDLNEIPMLQSVGALRNYNFFNLGQFENTADETRTTTVLISPLFNSSKVRFSPLDPTSTLTATGTNNCAIRGQVTYSLD
jgi:hypothetical protein